VHMTGGVAGFVGAAFLGPRLGRFENPDEFDGHSTPLQVIGTFLLWFGWYGFNGGSTLYINGYGRDMARVADTPPLSAARGGATGLIIKKYLPPKMGGDGSFSVGHTCNSILAGLVGITAGCCSVSAAGSIAIGFLSAFVYHGASCLMRKLKIDDPLDAFAVHGATGAWGCLAVGLFATSSYSYVPNTGNPMYAELGGYDSGAFAGGSKGAVLGAELVGLIIELVWVGGMSTLLFGGLKMFKMLRVSKEVEEAGLDSSKHGGNAYQTSGAKSVDA
jgi:Amt family ammonium transporter